MTDLNKLREEFETLPVIAHGLKHRQIYFDDGEDCYAPTSSTHYHDAVYANGAWYAYQEQQKLLDKAQKDSERIDFLADKEQWIVNVQMPREIVERNLDDLRNAIDEVIAWVEHGEKQ